MTRPPPAPRRRTPHAARAAATDRIAAAVDEASAAVADVDAALDGGTLEDLLALYGLLADLANVAKDGMAVVGAELIESVPDRFDAYQVPGGGIFKMAGGKERKRYDQERLIAAAAEAIRDAHRFAAVIDTDGEPLDAAAAVHAALKDFAALAGATAPSFDNWRSGAAKALGIRLNEYAELETSPITHRIEGRSRTGAADHHDPA